jgi:predicted nucleotidyltransferase component of viral defense system
LAHSVRDRLKVMARQSGEPFADVLVRYGLERMLYRLSCSEWRGRFTLKGAYLFSLWVEHPHRVTRDVDLAGRGRPDAAEVERIFRSLCDMAVEPDGLAFVAESVRTEAIRRADEYHGVRVRLMAKLKRARIPLQVDVGLGDAVEPQPEDVQLPVMLPEMPAPKLKAYTRYSVVAEKLHAIVEIGYETSRVKDYFDLHEMARQFEFDGDTLVISIRATFGRRKTGMPAATPAGLQDEFARDQVKLTMWRVFLRKTRPAGAGPALADVLIALRAFLLPPLSAARTGTASHRCWIPGKGWQAKAWRSPSD